MRSRYVVTDGIRLHCLEAGSGPLVLLLHGFPEIAYSWRHQVEALGAAGFHAVAPDLPGYGHSDKPDVAYDCEWVNACLAGLVGALGHERAVVAGHDWGGLLVWPLARRHPERVAGVIGVNTPDLRRPSAPPVEILRALSPDEPYYIVQFQDPGAAEWVFSWGRGARDFVEVIFRGLATRHPEVFTDEVLDVYADAFAPAGALTPPLDYYRNLDRNWALTEDLEGVVIDAPCLMICAADDPVLTPAMSEGMEDRIRDLDRVLIEDCGHWTQQEQPEATTAAMLAFLRRLPAWR